MRLAFISTMSGSPWGGSEELWVATAAHLRAAGHDVLAIVNRWPDVPAPLQQLERQGAEVVRTVPDRGLRRAMARFSGPYQRELNRFRPDAICISQGAAYEVPLQRRFHGIINWLGRSGTPYVVVCQLNTEASPLSDRSRPLAKSFFSQAKCTAFVAERNRRAAARHLVTDLSNALVVRNPVNLKSTEPLPWPAPDDSGGLRLACVARLETLYKGQDVLLEALSSQPWHSRPWRLTFCGAGPDEGYLRDLVERHGLGSKVQFAGQIEDIRALWAAQHALILPSREEGTPLAMVEAMVCGRPAIVTDVGGNSEWVRDGENGFLAGAPSVRELGIALEKAWLSRSRLAYLGLSARETAFRQCDPDPGRTLAQLLLSAAGAPARA